MSSFAQYYIRFCHEFAPYDWEKRQEYLAAFLQADDSIDIPVEIAPSQRYTTHLPVYPLRAACGYFDDCGILPEEEAEGWLDVSGQLRHLNKDMYIVHAEGRSMEPKIHDGDLCVFEKTAGSRQGKIVLAKAKDELDPDAGSYTIKQYSSESKADEDGRNIHTRIVLSPLNSEFQPIVIESAEAEEGDFCIYGELVQVI